MTQPATNLPLTARERLRWRRAMDALLMDAIFGKAVRDDSLPSEASWIAATALQVGADPDPSVSIG